MTGVQTCALPISNTKKGSKISGVDAAINAIKQREKQNKPKNKIVDL